jgi:hypothetical protein
MGKKGESQDAGSGDGYIDLMVAVATTQVEDAKDTRSPLRCMAARDYIFNDDAESENYIFGFKSVMNYLRIDPRRARAAIRKDLLPIPKPKP